MTTPFKLLEAWGRLSERERLVVESYISGSSFQAIGDQIGVSRQRAQQTYVGALQRLGIPEEQRRELSASHRALISEERRGRLPAALARLSAARKGKPLSEAHTAAISAAHAGKTRPPFSDEWRARLSAAQKARQARKREEEKTR
jgi:Sigma-70, region 4/NUMOD3 motif